MSSSRGGMNTLSRVIFFCTIEKVSILATLQPTHYNPNQQQFLLVWRRFYYRFPLYYLHSWLLRSKIRSSQCGSSTVSRWTLLFPELTVCIASLHCTAINGMVWIRIRRRICSIIAECTVPSKTLALVQRFTLRFSVSSKIQCFVSHRRITCQSAMEAISQPVSLLECSARNWAPTGCSLITEIQQFR